MAQRIRAEAVDAAARRVLTMADSAPLGDLVPYRLWIEEKDKAVWHWAMRPLQSLQYQAACGWQLSARHTLVWPQKPHEAGPPQGERCHTCVDVEKRTVPDVDSVANDVTQ